MKKLIPYFILLCAFLVALSPLSTQAQPSTGLTGGNPGSGIGGSNPQTPTQPSTQGPTSPVSTGQTKLQNPLKGVNSLADLFYKLINAVLSISYVVIAFFLLLSGFKFVTAQGSDEKLREAKTTFFNTIIGAVIIIGAKTIVEIVRSIISGLN